MTDVEAQFGPYRATKCEWSTPETCSAPVAEGKAYCEKHLKEAYRVPEKKVRKNTEYKQKINF